METMLLSGSTHPGRRRKENQDACIYRHLWGADKALLAVVDGVGGYAGGEKAAAIARECIEQYMQIPRGDTLTMLREAVVYANNKIVEARNSDHHLSEMCCVLTTVVADATTAALYYVHVGDTRLYRYRNGLLQKLTKDHSFVGIKEDAGDISELEAMGHPHRNQILREVGSDMHRLDDEDFMDYGREDFLPGDLLLLCSDGLTDMVTAQQVTAILSTSQPLDNKTNNLIDLANEMGGFDNITVVLLQYQLAEPPMQNIPVFAETAEAAVPKSSTKQKATAGKSKLPGAILLSILVAGASWYLTPDSEPPGKPSTRIMQSADTAMTDSNRIILAARGVHPAVPGPVITEKTDTLRLLSTQNLEDLKRYADSTGKILVLVPDPTIKRSFAAVEITSRSAKPGDTLLVKNLRLLNFETGINVRIPVLLKTENLVFENIRYPFSYLVKRENRTTPALLTNTVKR